MTCAAWCRRGQAVVKRFLAALGMTEEVKPVAGGDAGLEAKDGAAKGRKPARNDRVVKQMAGVSAWRCTRPERKEGGSPVIQSEGLFGTEIKPIA